MVLTLFMEQGWIDMVNKYKCHGVVMQGYGKSKHWQEWYVNAVLNLTVET